MRSLLTQKTKTLLACPHIHFLFGFVVFLIRFWEALYRFSHLFQHKRTQLLIFELNLFVNILHSAFSVYNKLHAYYTTSAAIFVVLACSTKVHSLRRVCCLFKSGRLSIWTRSWVRNLCCQLHKYRVNAIWMVRMLAMVNCKVPTSTSISLSFLISNGQPDTN